MQPQGAVASHIFLCIIYAYLLCEGMSVSAAHCEKLIYIKFGALYMWCRLKVTGVFVQRANVSNTGYTQKNGAVYYVISMDIAPFFCVYLYSLPLFCK